MDPTSQYSIRVFFDDQDGGYVAICPEFPGVSAFGDTREEALEEIGTALELAVEAYVGERWPLPEPRELIVPALPSGEFRVRLPRSVHAQLAERAVHEGVSQNQLVLTYVIAGLAGAYWRGALSGTPSVMHGQAGSHSPQETTVGSANLTSRLSGAEDEFTDPETWESASDVNSGMPIERGAVRLRRSVN